MHQKNGSPLIEGKQKINKRRMGKIFGCNFLDALSRYWHLLTSRFTEESRV